MALSTKVFKTRNPVQWTWPLKVGLPENIFVLKSQLLSKRWPKKFVSIHRIGKLDTTHYNIIFFDARVPFNGYKNLGNCTADVIIIISPYKKQGKDPVEGHAKFLLEHYKANGLFVYNTPGIADWFSRFIVELSHNNDIVNALKLTAPAGKLHYSKKLQTETSLTFVAKKLVKKLRSGKYSIGNLYIKNRLSPKTKFTSKELADLLQAKLKEPHFFSEEQDATDYSDLAGPVLRQMASKLPAKKIKKPVAKKSGGGKSYAIRPAAGSYYSPRSSGTKRGAAPKFKRASKRSKSVKKSMKRRKLKPMKKNGGSMIMTKSFKEKKHITPRTKSRARPEELPMETTAEPMDTTAAVPPEIQDGPRYLQASVETPDNKKAGNVLKTETDYQLKVRIGYKDKDFGDAGAEFDADTVFEESEQEEEPIKIKFKSNLSEKSQFKEIALPRVGNSNEVLFKFTTNTGRKKFEGEIFAYHKNRLIQHLGITLKISKTGKAAPTDKLEMRVIFCTRRNLSNMTGRTEFTASVEYEPGKMKASTLHGINKNKPVDLYSSAGLKENLAFIKTSIENALIDIAKHPSNLTAPGNQELLLKLALKGSLIYINHLRGEIAPEGPLQIVSNYQDYVPLDFVYSLNPPDLSAKLCKHAASALKQGACKNCFDHSLDPAPHICPFGFWSFNRVIERHSYQKRKNSKNSDYCLVSEPDGNRNILSVFGNAVFGSSERVETTQTKGIRKQIADGIKKNTRELYPAKDWKDWAVQVHEHKPDSLILVVHIENDKKLDIDKIEIGNKDFISQAHLGSKVVLKKEMKTPPFIIIIGCESTNLKKSGFDVSSQLMNEGAAIVLSNFTKIRGRQAKDIVIKLAEFIRQNAKKEISLGQVLLRLRQSLLSEGMIAGLSLVAQGDADWKIKT